MNASCRNFLLAMLAVAVPVLAQPVDGRPMVVAVVNGVDILDTEFEQAVHSIGRSSMYHGRPTEEAQQLEFRKNVMDQLIERKLLIAEANRRGLRADHEKIDEILSGYERRYSATERWKREGNQMLSSLRARFEEDELLVQLEQFVRETETPSDPALRRYYQQNLHSFTEPKQDRVSVILLGVQPSAGALAWQHARNQGADILRRLSDGADFAELARMRSSDASAASGGDMGYLHDGMLSGAAQVEIDSLSIGATSDPVTVLEGIAIFRLVERKPPVLRPYAEVRDRAAGLWRRDMAERKWQALLSELREIAVIQINEEYLASLPVAR